MRGALWGLWALSKGISGVGAPANSLLSREWRTNADWQTLHGGSRATRNARQSGTYRNTHLGDAGESNGDRPLK